MTQASVTAWILSRVPLNLSTQVPEGPRVGNHISKKKKAHTTARGADSGRPNQKPASVEPRGLGNKHQLMPQETLGQRVHSIHPPMPSPIHAFGGLAWSTHWCSLGRHGPRPKNPLMLSVSVHLGEQHKRTGAACRPKVSRNNPPMLGVTPGPMADNSDS